MEHIKGKDNVGADFLSTAALITSSIVWHVVLYYATEATKILWTIERVLNWLHCILDWNVGIFGVKLKLLMYRMQLVFDVCPSNQLLVAGHFVVKQVVDNVLFLKIILNVIYLRQRPHVAL